MNLIDRYYKDVLFKDLRGHNIILAKDLEFRGKPCKAGSILELTDTDKYNNLLCGTYGYYKYDDFDKDLDFVIPFGSSTALEYVYVFDFDKFVESVDLAAGLINNKAEIIKQMKVSVKYRYDILPPKIKLYIKYMKEHGYSFTEGV